MITIITTIKIIKITISKTSASVCPLLSYFSIKDDIIVELFIVLSMAHFNEIKQTSQFGITKICKQGNYSLRRPPKLIIPQAVIGKDGLLYI